ncbi:plasmid replication/partition related protein [Acidovorax sp. FJL06]|uniref:plasmid replication/partition related protein n=1 Tax=Acidovorax sp. FJL06 TaxID=2153365 RepID=UPI000F580EC5|nr:plasmid replication/partition related protein [Acidovorax sp. FJL06]RQO83224.1 plasmid replication/partition related protein [Acidovorax sp. FJL06]
MNIVVNEELKAYIEPLTPDEHDALERSILTEGCRDALVLWGDVLVDGHNRYGICQKHGLPFQTVQNPRFTSMEDVHLWMIDQHLGRRSVSDFQRGVLALRKREIISDRKARASTAPEPTESAASTTAEVPAAAPEAMAALPAPDPLSSREAIAKAARLSSSQVVMIEKIQKQAAPELVAAVKSGTISINAAAAVATLPAEEQVAAVVAGKDELKQAAKRVRESNKRKPRDEAPSEEKSAAETTETTSSAEGGADELHTLRSRVAELTAENTELRRQVAQLQAALPAGSAPF